MLHILYEIARSGKFPVQHSELLEYHVYAVDYSQLTVILEYIEYRICGTFGGH